MADEASSIVKAATLKLEMGLDKADESVLNRSARFADEGLCLWQSCLCS